MNELALFAGAGGGILASKLLGWRTVCAVEWEAYPSSVLCARQNDGLLPPFPIWDDIQTFDGTPWRGIAEVVSGGFPCTDISIAGRGAGLDGEHSSMWYHMARVVSEIRPQFVFVENSPMLIHRGLGRVLGDLSCLGYDSRWTVMGAADVGAPHQRDRIWIVAHARHGGGGTSGLLKQGKNYRENGQPIQIRLVDQVNNPRLWPTPVQRMYKDSGSPSEYARNEIPLAAQVGGPLNPPWVEWLMGWPLGWTDLKPLEMDKCLYARQPHGESSQKDN